VYSSVCLRAWFVLHTKHFERSPGTSLVTCRSAATTGSAFRLPHAVCSCGMGAVPCGGYLPSCYPRVPACPRTCYPPHLPWLLLC
jgi:hypothetical protein